MSLATPTHQLKTALVTASYRGDFERCRLLCESIDLRVSGHSRHVILVESRDLSLFRQLAGPKREIVDERSLLPRFLRAFPDPTTMGRRRIWLSPYGPPLRGWHVQQLRRLAMAAALDETVMVSLDSDVVFVKDFDVGHFQDEGRVRFFRRPGIVEGFEEPFLGEHRGWARTAAQCLGLPGRPVNDNGYVATLIAWRSDTVRDMRHRIEGLGGRDWIRQLAGTRSLSECVLYGRFVDEVEARPDRHRPGDDNLCAMVWEGEAMGEQALDALLRKLEPHQVAIGIQSFTGTDPAVIRRAVKLA